MVCIMVLFGLLNFCYGGSLDFINEIIIIFSWWWFFVELCLGIVCRLVFLLFEGKIRLICLVGVYFYIGLMYILLGSDICW